MIDYEHRDLTVEEVKAVTALQRLATTWPKTLRLASMDGELIVEDLTHPEVFSADSDARQEATVATVGSRIKSTGGAW